MVDIELDGQTVRIPEFAMDKSIQTLIQLAKKQGLDITSIEKSDKRTATVLSRMEKTLTDQAKEVAKQTKESQKGIQAQKKESSETAKVRQAINDSTKSNSEKLEKLAEKLGDKGAGGMLGGLVGKLGPFAKFLSVAGAAFGGLVTAVTTAFKFLMRLGQLEGTLFRTGFFSFESQQGLAQGITSLTVSATNARLSLEQATEILIQYSKAMDAFGSETILSAAKSTQDLLESQSFLAMSYEEIAQAVAEQGQVFAQAGLSVGANGNALARHSAEVLRTTQAFSDLTNTSADLIRSLVLQASSNQVFLNRIQMLPEAIRNSTFKSAQVAFAGLAAFGEVAGGELSRMLSEGIGFGNLAFSQSFRDLVVTSPQLADSLYNLQQTITGGGNVVDSMESLRQTVLNVSDGERERLNALSIMGDQQASMVLTLINQQQLLTDETNNFVKMMAKASELEAGPAANIRARLQAAMTALSTQFQKLAASFLTPEVMSTISSIMETLTNFVKKIGGDKGLLDTIGNKITQVLNNSEQFMKKIKDFFTNSITGFTSFIESALTGGISAGISRGVALAIKGGTNAEDLATYDKLVDQYKNAKNEKERSQILSQLADAAGVQKSYISQYGSYEDGSGDINTSYSPAQLEERIKNAIGKFYTGGDPFSNTKPFGPPTGIVNPNEQGTQESDGMTGTSRQKIRILPMFGDPTSYLEKKPMTQEEYQKKTIELQQEGNETLRLLAMGQKTQTTVQEKNLAFKKFKGL